MAGKGSWERLGQLAIHDALLCPFHRVDVIRPCSMKLIEFGHNHWNALNGIFDSTLEIGIQLVVKVSRFRDV